MNTKSLVLVKRITNLENIIAKQLNRLLIEKFPELEKEYHEEVDWQEGDETGSHVVYGDVFAPYVEKIVMQQNSVEMQKVFAFIEEILLKNEKYSDEVIVFSVLEGLMLDKEQFESCKKYFGKYTERAIKECNNSKYDSNGSRFL